MLQVVELNPHVLMLNTPGWLVQAFFSDERSKGRTYAELYELVQHAGNVLPRL